MKTSWTIEIAKLGTVVELANLPEASVDYGTEYGFKQSLNDAAASCVRKNYADGAEGDAAFAADVSEKVNERAQQLRDGTPPGSRSKASPEVLAARKTTAKLVESGIKELTPEMIAVLVKMAEKARKAA